jgi:hypothetical protein
MNKDIENKIKYVPAPVTENKKCGRRYKKGKTGTGF